MNLRLALVVGVSVAFPALSGCGSSGGGDSPTDTTVVIHTETLPGGVTGASYGATIDATFANEPGVFIVESGQLPLGVTLDPLTGTLAGFPRQTGTFRFRLAAQDGPDPTLPKGRDATFSQALKEFQIQVVKGPPTILTTFLPTAQYRAPFSAQIDVAGGTAPYTFAQTGGTLPTGLQVFPNGQVGTFPTQANQHPYTFEVTVTDAEGLQDTQSITVDVIVKPLLIATTEVPDGETGQPYDFEFVIASVGGGAPYTWQQVTPTIGEVPLSVTGMEISPNGHLRNMAAFTGPTTQGTFLFTVSVTDEAGQVATRQYTLEVTAPRPVLDSITPNKSTIPGPYTAVGRHFQPGAQLIFNPGPGQTTITPTWINAQTLQFAAAPAVAGCGPTKVRVRNPDGLFTDTPKAFLYPCANLVFGQKGLLSSGLSSTGLACEDVNGDGLADIVHSGASSFSAYPGGPSSTTGGLQLLMNAGGLSFTTVNLDSASYYDVKFVDVNVDGQLDIVAAGASSIRTWINEPLGSFSPGPISSLPNDSNFVRPSEMAIGYFNGDLIPDLAFGVSHYNNTSGRVYTMTGNGSGSFNLAGAAVTTLASTYGVNSLACVDVNGDGRSEVAAGQGWGNSSGPIFRLGSTDGNGLFTGWTNYGTLLSWGNVLGVAAGNFRGTGVPSLVTMNSVDLNDGGGRLLQMWHGSSLSTSVNISPPATAGKSVGVGDFDFDGADDFAISANPSVYYYQAVSTAGTLVIYRGGTSPGPVQTINLLSGTPTVNGAMAGRVATGDVDGDGKTDVLVTTSYWAYDYQPHFYSSFPLRLAGDGTPQGVVYYLNASN
jgi:hypothetical protein